MGCVEGGWLLLAVGLTGLLRLPFVDGSHVSIITIVIGQNPMYGYYASAPAFDVAFDLVGAKYPAISTNITPLILYKQDAISGCEDTAAMMYTMVQEVFKIVGQSKGFPIILSPGCSLEIITLGDFARELNVPLLTITSGDSSLANRDRYPTLTTFSPAGQGLTSLALRTFMRMNKWRTITIFCDSLSLFPSAATVYIIACRSFRAVLTEVSTEFQMYYEGYDSRNKPDYAAMLRRATMQSRIILFGTNANFFRRIMVIAHNMGLTNGDHVFIYAEAMTVPQTSLLTWKANDGLDETVLLQAFECVIMLRFPFPNWDELRPFTDAVKDRALQSPFNYTYAPDEILNDVSLAGYEAVLVMTKILNESWDNLDQLDARTFSNRIAGRSHDLGFDVVNISSNGMRCRDTWIARFNQRTTNFETTWYHHWVGNVVTVESPLANDWFGKNKLPPDIPLCGFRNESCARSGSDLTGTIVAPVIVLALLIGGGSIAYFVWSQRLSQVRNSTWWRLDPHLVQITYPTGNSRKLRSGGDLSQVSNFSEVQKSASTIMYNNEKIWMQEKHVATSLHQLSANKLFRHTVAEVRLLNHENIGLFMGVLVFANSVALVWQLGRDSVRALLDDNKIRLDRPLQISMILEILNGLKYIHSSRLSYHGSLSASYVMLDSRFAIKITNQASTRIFRSMGCPDINQSMPVHISINFLWMAPEQILTMDHEGSRAADVYSMGLTMLEIMTSGNPLDVNKDDPVSVAVALSELKQPDAPRFDLSRWMFPVGMLTIIQSCLATDERVRPTIQEVLRVWKQFDPHTNIMNSIFERLQVYSSELEGLVAARSDELLAETEKVDQLLREIIPSIYVSSLRNREEIPVEKFDCATVLFSSLVGFEAFCAISTPLAVVTLLNKLYVTFDPVLQRYDVYTVETTRDGYLIASGLPIRNSDRHVHEIALVAIELMQASSKSSLMRISDELTLQIRIGVHSGPCAAGVVGTRMPRYCLFGDTINVASRMESHGVAMKIQISEATMLLLKEQNTHFVIESRGIIEVKGKGSHETFFLSSGA